MKKILNKNQTICLLADILSNDVKKEGQYVYGNYVISVHKNITPKQKKINRCEEARINYYKAIEEGRCVKCGKKHNSGKVKCKKCNARANKLKKIRSRKNYGLSKIV